MALTDFTVHSAAMDTTPVSISLSPPVACQEAQWCLPPSALTIGHSDQIYANDSLANRTLYSLDADDDEVEVSTYKKIAVVLRTQVVVGICIVGMLGNILNLLFMAPRICRRGGSMGRITQYSYAGMIALATSDLNFCIIGMLPLFLRGLQRTVCQLDFSMVYHAYAIALFNLFLLESTWLTVAMAAGRYIAICHPFRAKQWIGMKMFWRSVLILTLVCIVFNIPRFWTYELVKTDCNGTIVYRLHHGFLKRHPHFETVYQWMYFVLGIVIPLVILSYCNTFLIKALRNISSNGPAMPAGVRGGQESTRHITLTFVAIIIIYIVLVTPSEVIGFMRKHILVEEESKDKYNLLVDISNTLQAFNFSLNFVVYCIINTSFRNSVINALRCIVSPRSKMNNKDIYTSVTTNTAVNGRQSFMLAASPRASLV